MNLFILAFLFGDLWLQTFSSLPQLYFAFILLIAAIIPFLFFKNKYYLILPFAFAAGFTWTAWYAHANLSWTLKKELEGKPFIITGSITSLPHAGRFGTQFEFHVDKFNSNIRLTWMNAPVLNVGDQWRLLVKLKRIHAVQSPGTYDYEAFALQRGIRASGSVRASQTNKRLSQSIFSPRQILLEKIQLYGPHTQTSPWLAALIIGERNGISPEDWQVLRNTGTNHLMAIGGLHIGILAGFAYAITSFFWRRIANLALKMPAQHAGASAAFLMTVIYSSLSGFSLPSQRASIMLSVFFIALQAKRKINPWNAWFLAIFCVLMMNPLSVLSESFWLSFGTIGLILYGMGHRLAPTGFWWKHARVQWVIGFGLIPLTLVLFQECSLLSFIANSMAIPWLAMTILPLCFLSAVFLFIFPTLAGLCLQLADKSLAGLWMVLSSLSHFQLAAIHIYIPGYFSLMLMMMGFLFFLLPAGLPGRYLGIIWILPVFLYHPQKPPQGDYWVSLLDVGQGLSVVIQTASHTLVYDAGPRFLGGADMGESVVLPYLRKLNTRKIDAMVISHGDNDHIGGMVAILHEFPDTPVITSVPEKIPSPHAQFCNAGESFQWDHVSFTFLSPFHHEMKSRNDGSCVLMIDNGHHKVLLAGDIEKAAEKELLLRSPEKLPASMIVAPHHGSKTSGIKSFIAAVHPQIVLYATGYRNRYHFPHKSVVAAYENIHAAAYNTVDTGTILFKFLHDDMTIPAPEAYRIMNKKYWYDES